LTHRGQRRDRRGVPGVIVPEIDEVEWDDEVDIVCVGTGSAALAAAVAADADGLDVLLTDGRGASDAETVAGRLGLTDDSAEYLDSVTEDTGPLGHADASAELTVCRTGEPLLPALGAGVSFSGAALRDWAAACLASPHGLLRTAVAGADAAAVRVGTIEAGVPVDIGRWLLDHSRYLGITAREQTSLGGLVFADGQVVGAVVDTPDGPSLVRAVGGVVVPTGAGVWLPHLATEGLGGLGGAATVDLVVLTRPFSRFARLGLLVSGRDD
jgi:hypothetical protein